MSFGKLYRLAAVAVLGAVPAIALGNDSAVAEVGAIATPDSSSLAESDLGLADSTPTAQPDQLPTIQQTPSPDAAGIPNHPAFTATLAFGGIVVILFCSRRLVRFWRDGTQP